MAEYKADTKSMSSLQKKTKKKNKSHDITVLNAVLNIDLHMKLPVLIQAMCQTVNLDTWAAARLADEKTVCAQYSWSQAEIQITDGSWVSPSHMGPIKLNEQQEGCP